MNIHKRHLALLSMFLLAMLIAAPLFAQANPRASIFLLIDEDAIDNGTKSIENISFNAPHCGNGNPAPCVNDNIANPGVRTPLFTQGKDITPYNGLVLPTGQRGDEGLFRFGNPGLQRSLQNGATFTLEEFVRASGAAANENNLDKIAGVTPLGASDIQSLVGQTVCAVVYDSDISVSVSDGYGNLKGATLGVTAFTVTATAPNPNGGSYLPLITVSLLPSNQVATACQSLWAVPTPTPTVEPTPTEEPAPEQPTVALEPVCSSGIPAFNIYNDSVAFSDVYYSVTDQNEMLVSEGYLSLAAYESAYLEFPGYTGPLTLMIFDAVATTAGCVVPTPEVSTLYIEPVCNADVPTFNLYNGSEAFSNVYYSVTDQNGAIVRDGYLSMAAHETIYLDFPGYTGPLTLTISNQVVTTQCYVEPTPTEETPVPTEEPTQAALFLLIDEDTIDNGIGSIENISFNAPHCGNGNPAPCVNDNIANPGVRAPLFTQGKDITPYNGLVLPTGQTGDEGLFRFTKADPQLSLQNGATFSTQEFVTASGAAANENNLDKISGVKPLGMSDIHGLVGQTVCAVVYDSDISVSISDRYGNLKGATLGVTAFTVTASAPNPNGGSYLPLITVSLLSSAEMGRACQNFSAQLMPVPAPISVNIVAQTQTPTLVWSPVDNADCYLIQVDNEVNFNVPLVQEATVVAKAVYVTQPLANGTYYWRVQVGGACYGVTPGRWSSTGTLTISAR
jgi:hypothetical protein